MLRLTCPTEVPTMSLSALNSKMGCFKCGATKKFGRHSRGGVWLKNCIDTVNTRFYHTWDDGIQACKYLSTSISVKSTKREILHHVGVSGYPSNTPTPRIFIRDHINIHLSSSVSNAVTTGSEDYVALTKVVYICVLCVCYVAFTDCKSVTPGLI